ncbi:MAG: alpha/beta fold hydrolase [Deltaproteobacteria bacterium]|nr:alpha/beta fold hydrolase [Deltaproteobacteria bacterium]
MRVFLIHGMGRTSASMALLGRRLRLAGHATSSFGYLVSRQTIDDIADRWVEHIERNRKAGGDDGDDDGSFAVVGHSLGNVITRKALPHLPSLARFVMLAPPNHPPAMARALERSPVFRALTQDAGQKLLDVDGGFYASLPVPTMPTLIVAGDGGPRFARSPWKGGANDGVVSVDETRLEGIETVVVDAIHTLIMNQREVAGLTLRFLA